jgi:hypothetical protein
VETIQIFGKASGREKIKRVSFKNHRLPKLIFTSLYLFVILMQDFVTGLDFILKTFDVGIKHWKDCPIESTKVVCRLHAYLGLLV